MDLRGPLYTTGKGYGKGFKRAKRMEQEGGKELAPREKNEKLLPEMLTLLNEYFFQQCFERLNLEWQLAALIS